ncbi:TPA: 50S ribosomal protein L29 [bacterium]|nr:50S ribosomal protein L29 [bacterium]
MKVSELKEFTEGELQEKRKIFANELITLRHQRIIRQIENPKRIREIKKTIARINTILRERELNQNAK